MKAAAELLEALYLVALAGCVDAIGYLHLGHLFVSFMSGNSTRMAVELAEGRWPTALVPAGLVALFVAGSFLGSLLSGAVGRWRLPAVLAAETALLAAALLLPRPGGPLPLVALPMALAMGVQNATLHRAGSVRLGPTYVTGTLATLGHLLAEAVTGRAGPWSWLPYALLWLALIAGAVGGAWGYARLGVDALRGPLLGTTCLTLITAGALGLARRRARAPSRASRGR